MQKLRFLNNKKACENSFDEMLPIWQYSNREDTSLPVFLFSINRLKLIRDNTSVLHCLCLAISFKKAHPSNQRGRWLWKCVSDLDEYRFLKITYKASWNQKSLALPWFKHQLSFIKKNYCNGVKLKQFSPLSMLYKLKTTWQALSDFI